jgi:hypothetical protein
MRVFRKETEQVINARTIDEVRDLARERARARRDPAFLATARRDAWDDTGALKRHLLDDLTRERNDLAERVMKDVERRRHELQREPAR